MTTKATMFALALAAAAFATTMLLNESASANGLKAQGPALSAPVPSRLVPPPSSITVKQPGLAASPVKKVRCGLQWTRLLPDGQLGPYPHLLNVCT
jgi:hypothetical protein